MSYLPSSFDNTDADPEDMGFWDKMVFHCKQQPLVPLGTLATTGAVILAAQSMRRGNKKDTQKWFRWRVGLQGLTLVALVAGSFIYGKNEKKSVSQQEQLHQKAKLREQLWIQELERRDAETQMRKKKAEMVRQKTKELEAETAKIQEELKELESKLKT